VPRLFDRFSTGFKAARDCWQVLREDKSLGLVSSALETILLPALYLCVTQEEVPNSMDKKVLRQAFVATS